MKKILVCLSCIIAMSFLFCGTVNAASGRKYFAPVRYVNGYLSGAIEDDWDMVVYCSANTTFDYAADYYRPILKLDVVSNHTSYTPTYFFNGEYGDKRVDGTYFFDWDEYENYGYTVYSYHYTQNVDGGYNSDWVFLEETY